MEDIGSGVRIDDGTNDEFDELVESALDGVEFGLAVFDHNLNLIQANDSYFRLCEYEAADFPPGTPLGEMIRTSLQRRGVDGNDIDASISATLLRLKVGGGHKFVFETSSGASIYVNRTHNKKGQLIETVQEATRSGHANRASDKLRQLAEVAHARMMRAMNATTDGFALYDSSDRLTFYNNRFVDFHPSTADLIKPGVSFEILLKNGVMRNAYELNGMSPQIYIHWRLQQHFSPGDSHEYELSDGRWIRNSEQPTEDGGIVSTLTDITEIKKREIEIARISVDLNRTSDHFNEALNNMIQGLCMFDNNQRLIICNERYLEMYGFSEEVVKPGISISDVMRYSISLGNYRDEDAQAALKARHDPSRLKRRTTIKQHLRDGRVIAVMNEPMANGGTIATYQDITALERHEARLVAYMKKLEISNRELQDFAYVASHDLQEPLRKIEAFGDRLVRKYGAQLPEDGQMYVDRMQNAAMRMRQLINDLLSYSRVTTNAKPFKSVDIGDVIGGILTDLQITLQEGNGEVHFGDLPSVMADKTQMRQLFQNIIVNSLKYRKPDVDPVVNISAEKAVRQTASGEVEPIWKFLVSDNGIGFENQYKDQIFKIFQRLHGRAEYEGTGIGLATCRKIVERHGGSIDATGEPGVGATFIVELPETQSNLEENEQ